MIRCTKCGERINPQEGQAEGEWADIIRLLPAFEKHSRIAFEYVELFSVMPIRMKGKKILRLLTGIAKLYQSEKFIFDRREYRISKAGIVEALTIVCNKHFTVPLENHHYLQKVMIGISERELSEARDLEDKIQRENERRLRSGGRDQGSEGRITAQEYKSKKGIKSLVDSIGQKNA